MFLVEPRASLTRVLETSTPPSPSGPINLMLTLSRPVLTPQPLVRLVPRFKPCMLPLGGDLVMWAD
jgi:hypothetical protein